MKEQGLEVRDQGSVDTSPTIPEKPEKPEKTDAASVILKRPEPEKLTPCGYPAGGLRASDGTQYVVKETGQIVRREPKVSKAELKRDKKARRAKRTAGGDACATVGETPLVAREEREID